MNETIENMMARIERESKIWCPHCGAEYDDEDVMCLSYCGEDGPVIVTCLTCEKEFEVDETVRRTYETKVLDEAGEKG